MLANSITVPANVNVIWQPLPGSQSLALDSRAHETLFHGTRGPGKTETQLMFFKKNVGKGYGSFWRGVIFDCEYKGLDDVLIKSKRLFNKFNDGAEWLSSTSVYKWVWPTGEELLLRAAATIEDYDKFHGQEFPFIGWNELTKYKNLELYDAMLSCNRSSFTEKDWPIDPKNGKRIALPPIPEVVFSTTNSKGIGRLEVKRRFIDVGSNGELIKSTRKIYNPGTQQEEDFTSTQVAIFGSFKENKYLSHKYIAQLTAACKDENTRKSWLEGDWNIVVGGAFNDLWADRVHVLPRFRIPSSWYINRTFDWGSTHPFSVGWWAEANGEEAAIKYNGKYYKFCPPKGTLIRFAEWYGTEAIGTNKGLKMSAGMIAEGIKEKEAKLVKDKWIVRLPFAGPADNQIRNVIEEDVETIEKKMSDHGIRWLPSDKSPGSRVNGFLLFRERLETSIDFHNKKETNEAGIYFMNNCLASIAIIPNLERDEKHLDDVDTRLEDHPYDETRYRVLQSANRLATDVNFKWAV